MNRQVLGSALTILAVMIFGAACDAKCTFDARPEPSDASTDDYWPVDI